jgi:hypothetical protein
MGTARFVPELLNPYCVASALCNSQEKTTMAAAKKTARGRAQDRTKVAGGQRYEVSYEAKKTGRSAPAVKKAVKKVGNVRKTVEKRLSGKRK